jgi:hypothetical protein
MIGAAVTPWKEKGGDEGSIRHYHTLDGHVEIVAQEW